MNDRRLEHFSSLQALARTGLHFCKDEYDRERYAAIERIAIRVVAGGRVRHTQGRGAWRSIPSR